MLHLACPTAEDWYDRIAPDLDLILIDHAHLEKRAASTALSMIFKYTSRRELIRELSVVVQEEMEHFSRMLEVLERRGVEFEKLEPAPYASNLVRAARKHEPEALLDKLLVAGFIEARSCERFQILARRVEDPALAEFYRELSVSEARHHTLYTRLARTYFEVEQVRERLAELARAEVEALEASAGEPRLHSA